MKKTNVARSKRRRLGHLSLGLLSAVTTAYASGQAAKTLEGADFTTLSLDQLASIKVTSVSKKPESLSAVPSAVTVITGEEIHRSGAETLPEALRLVPGVQVAQVNAHTTAVSVRGFNDTFAQKLLVLVDGRSVYSPLFSGTFWQAEDLVLEDVERIEVIRGPGASVWGANAVNGVINVVSKPARDTQGFLVTAGGGTEHPILTSVRYGTQLSENTFLRIYGKYDDWENSRLVGGGDANDEWWKAQGGFRLDWDPTSNDRFTFQGDLYGLESDETFPQISFPVFLAPPPPGGYTSSQQGHFNLNGGNVLGRWTHQFTDKSDLSVQTFYDRSNLSFPLLRENRDTGDLDLRHHFFAGERNEFVWGGGYRLTESRLEDSPVLSLNRLSRSDSIFNAFGQDEITIVPERLRWTLGTKVEHNDYTGWEVEPGTRLSWTPTDKQTIWGSVARAVRTPSQIERDGRFTLGVLPANPPTAPLPTVVAAVGNSQFVSEELLAYEIGYRIQPHERFAFDAAAFLNEYDNLRGSVDQVDLSAAPNFVGVNSLISNNVHGRTYGGEVAATWQALDWWRLQGQVSLLEADLKAPPNAITGASQTQGLSSPEYQLSLRSSMDLPQQISLDAFARYVDRIDNAGVALPGFANAGSSIPGYATLDVRVAWRAKKNLELSVVGQDLAGTHREFVPTFISTQYTEVRPSVYGKILWRF